MTHSRTAASLEFKATAGPTGCLLFHTGQCDCSVSTLLLWLLSDKVTTGSSSVSHPEQKGEIWGSSWGVCVMPASHIWQPSWSIALTKTCVTWVSLRHDIKMLQLQLISLIWSLRIPYRCHNLQLAAHACFANANTPWLGFLLRVHFENAGPVWVGAN